MRGKAICEESGHRGSPLGDDDSQLQADVPLPVQLETWERR
jgi:hypothetical protein